MEAYIRNLVVKFVANRKQQVSIYPFGLQGNEILSLLHALGYQEKYLIDNELARYADKVIGLKELGEDDKDSLFVVSSEKRPFAYDLLQKGIQPCNILNPFAQEREIYLDALMLYLSDHKDIQSIYDQNHLFVTCGCIGTMYHSVTLQRGFDLTEYRINMDYSTLKRTFPVYRKRYRDAVNYEDEYDLAVKYLKLGDDEGLINDGWGKPSKKWLVISDHPVTGLGDRWKLFYHSFLFVYESEK